MPTILREGPYRFFFYSADGHEPEHTHIERDHFTAKFWLDPVRLADSHGFGPTELRQIERLVVEQRMLLLKEWHEYFNT